MFSSTTSPAASIFVPLPLSTNTHLPKDYTVAFANLQSQYGAPGTPTTRSLRSPNASRAPSRAPSTRPSSPTPSISQPEHSSGKDYATAFASLQSSFGSSMTAPCVPALSSTGSSRTTTDGGVFAPFRRKATPGPSKAPPEPLALSVSARDPILSSIISSR